MDLKGVQQAVDMWIQNHGVRYFNELTNMAQLTEEVGEVARIIARKYGEQSEKESDKNKVGQCAYRYAQWHPLFGEQPGHKNQGNGNNE